ncbi:hypothetical protein RI054_43g151610 [Pseudoscourfieldia marina]
MQTALRRLLAIPTSAYVDDYFTVDLQHSAVSSQQILQSFFAEIGIVLKTRKSVSPDTTCVLLGVVVDLSRACSGIITISTMPERLARVLTSRCAAAHARR